MTRITIAGRVHHFLADRAVTIASASRFRVTSTAFRMYATTALPDDASGAPPMCCAEIHLLQVKDLELALGRVRVRRALGRSLS